MQAVAAPGAVRDGQGDEAAGAREGRVPAAVLVLQDDAVDGAALVLAGQATHPAGLRAVDGTARPPPFLGRSLAGARIIPLWRTRPVGLTSTKRQKVESFDPITGKRATARER